MAAVAELIKRHLPSLLTYLRHRLTNGGLEGVNAVIQWVKKTARAFRNAEHFKTPIYFHRGGLDLFTLTKACRSSIWNVVFSTPSVTPTPGSVSACHHTERARDGLQSLSMA
jgi:hypothetical protein